MPGSAISASAGSQTSSSSRRARTRQYHVVAHTSQVDESLFGTSQKDKQKNGGPGPDIEQLARERSAKRLKNKKGNKHNKETVQVITKDLIRNLIVPEEDPSGRSLVLHFGDYLRLRNTARVLSEEEKLMVYERAKAAKEATMDEVHDRKNTMKMADLNRLKNEKLSDIEKEEQEKAEYLQKKANQQRQEQEDEIKYLNEMILNAKCHAIRDAQILEKVQIVTEMTGEEKRLDSMMEADRQRALQVQEEIEKKRKDERLLGAMKIMEQINENEQERLLELERKDQENKSKQKYLDKLCVEEAERLDKKRDEQQRLREELNKCNADIIQRKELTKEQEKLLDQNVLEYQEKKADREQAYEREQERIRIEKEKEVARLRAQQERARDEQAERDALRAKRAQEQAEREWRQKEAEEQRKKSDTEDMLKRARAQQMDQKEHFLAVQAQRERADFERVLKAQKELVEKEKCAEGEKRDQRDVYAEEVRVQIRDKESERIRARQQFFEEGVKLDEEARQRRSRLDDIKRKKLEELRSMGLHDKYVMQVSRKANVALEA